MRLHTMLILLCLSTVGLDAMAAQGRWRRNRGNRETAKQQQEKEQAALHSQHVNELPPAELISEFDTARIDDVTGKTELSQSQKEKIRELVSRITEKRKRLLREQEDARSGFSKAKESACLNLAEKLKVVAQTCKEYEPLSAFLSELSNILPRDKWLKYESLAPHGKATEFGWLCANTHEKAEAARK